MSKVYSDEFISFHGISELSKQFYKDGVDLSLQIEILTGFLEKLDPNTENFVNNMNAITDKILLLKNEQIKFDKEITLNKSFCLQQIFGINNYIPANRNDTTSITQYSSK